MKRPYATPVAEKVAFCYRDQVVASNNCISVWVQTGVSNCSSGNAHLEYTK